MSFSLDAIVIVINIVTIEWLSDVFYMIVFQTFLLVNSTFRDKTIFTQAKTDDAHSD